MKRARGQTGKRAALRALERAKRAAAEGGAELSDWEDEFLGSVEQRVKSFGRAFADPAKGAPGESLSTLQQVKLKEIANKAKGGGPRVRKPLRAKRPMQRSRPPRIAG